MAYATYLFKKKTKFFWAFVVVLFVVSCTSKSKFLGSAKNKKKSKETTTDEVVLATEEDNFVEFAKETPIVAEKKTRKSFWIVTFQGELSKCDATKYKKEGKVLFVKLKDDSPNTVELKKEWTYCTTADAGGTRTYVTEAGLVFSKLGTEMFTVNISIPESKLIEPSWRYSDIYDQVRGCVVSYKRNNKRFVGMGWANTNSQHIWTNRMFVEFDMIEKASEDVPYLVDFAHPHLHTLGDLQGDYSKIWGYSCFIDQKKLIYYGAQHNVPTALNLNNFEEIPIGTALDTAIYNKVKTSPINGIVRKPDEIDDLAQIFPSEATKNTFFKDVQLAPRDLNDTECACAATNFVDCIKFTWKTLRTSYAIAGSKNDVLLAGENMYTFTHEPDNNYVWATTLSPYMATCPAGSTFSWNDHLGDNSLINIFGSMVIFSGNCLTSDKECPGYTIFDRTKIQNAANVPTVAIGPVSSLSGGYIIGLTRWEPFAAYLLSLKNPANITEGLKVEKLLDLPGNPYMYTDFTGATLYALPTTLFFDLTEDEKFIQEKKIKVIKFSWESESGLTDWPKDNLELQARCMIKDESPALEFETVSSIGTVGEETDLEVSSCKREFFETAEFKVIPINNEDGSTFDKIKTIKLHFIQEK